MEKKFTGNEIIKFNFTLNEASIILNALSNMPFKQVRSLVEKIEITSDNQLIEKPKGTKETE